MNTAPQSNSTEKRNREEEAAALERAQRLVNISAEISSSTNMLSSVIGRLTEIFTKFISGNSARPEIDHEMLLDMLELLEPSIVALEKLQLRQAHFALGAYFLFSYLYPP